MKGAGRFGFAPVRLRASTADAARLVWPSFPRPKPPAGDADAGTAPGAGGRCTLSALAVLLPQVRVATSVARGVQMRKGPHCLRVVRACAVESVPLTEVEEECAARGVRVLPEVHGGDAAAVHHDVHGGWESAVFTGPRAVSRQRDALQGPQLRGRGDFRHDVENCLDKLGRGQQHLIRRIALEEYTQGETAAMLGISLRSVVRNYTDALDRLTRLFLEKGMLQPLTASREEAFVL